MIDPVYIALLICLLASNLNRILRISRWLFNYFNSSGEDDLVPYFNQDGQLIGMVFETDSRSKPESPKHVRKTWMREAPVDTHSVLKTQDAPMVWDYWPNGNFQRFVSVQELTDSNDLATNWVLETIQTRGSANASTWQKGKEIRRRCLGVVQCRDKTCAMQLVPATRAVERHKQLQYPCPTCEESLVHQPCVVESSLYRFRDGGFFKHTGIHAHSEFTHASFHCPDGSLVFMDYIPRFVLSIDPGPTEDPSKSISENDTNQTVQFESRESTPSEHPHDFNSKYHQTETGQGTSREPSDSDELEKWEIDQDPLADAAEEFEEDGVGSD
ncbi:hypothetical protein B0H16DRAFT_1816469 [Mycena metata]|uniref:Uncharacterized protein n=1 Tax=Mycena metata TaxID=1033252 RepID=A0AAD7H4B6_9AGAR|nr:hypothetical protein B0H16DRAFT_1816469 [Mycena metata]